MTKKRTSDIRSDRMDNIISLLPAIMKKKEEAAWLLFELGSQIICGHGEEDVAELEGQPSSTFDLGTIDFSGVKIGNNHNATK